jgi:mono/diheme cytochrome c family protein
VKFVLVFLMVTAVAQADEPGPTFGNPYRFTEQGGEAIYRSVCVGCHMPDGRGASGAARYPSLRDNPSLATVSLPISMVLQGHKAMPPFGSSLTDEQIAAVVAYIRTHFGNDFAAAVTAADVAAKR